MKILIITPWVKGTDAVGLIEHHPLFEDILKAGGHPWTFARDITYQPANNIVNIAKNINVCVWEIEDVSQTAVDALKTDGRCFVITSPETKTDQDELDAINIYLQNQGVSSLQTLTIIGVDTNQTSRQVTNSITTWAKDIT